MISCPGVEGIAALACISEQTNYIIGYVLILLLVGMFFYKLQGEPTKERFASIMFFIAIVTAMGAVEQMLFPTYYFMVAFTLALGAAALLVIRK